MRSPALDSAAAWMAARSRREQVMIAFLGGLIVIAVVWLAILRPLLDARTTAIGRIAAYEQVLVDVRTAGGAVTTSTPALSGPLPEAIPVQAATFGIVPTVTGDASSAEVSVTGARYDAVIPWLAALEASGATLSSVTIRRAASEGVVDVTLRVIQP
ncbi:type II secretion system protein GspM [Brevundimonas sp.]|uniref:type II secretion system protein GspM n=1 Tax=Brevundimonas sp. TaxID=1871086 RepID=UPI0026102575|nr:type II secretion system protein GspM [Brevundimonas sp.]